MVQVLVAVQAASTNDTSVGGSAWADQTATDDVSVTLVSTPEQAIARLTGRDGPDVVLLDFSMPGLSGLSGVRTLRKIAGALPIGLLLSDTNTEVTGLALTAGATSVLPREMQPAAFRAAIAMLHAGQSFVVYPSQAIEYRLERATTLSDREIQVLEGICRGLQNKEIAHAFGIQEVTVKMHVRSIIRKLGARNRTHAAMIARDLALA